uniref:Somatostatin-like receptor F_48D10.1 n=1 Tax=Poecilia reticulata TaxID=8081 RepID=A0A3P9MTA6_POERE
MDPPDPYWYPLPAEPNSSGAAGSPFFFPYPRLLNVSSNMSTQSAPFQGSSTPVTAIIYFTVFLVGLTGNTLAIYVVLRYAKMKTVTNIYILNLAVADELYIIGLPFLTTQNVLSYWPFGSFLCRVVMTADSMNQFTSIFCLTVMSMDRYLAVVHPIRSTKWRHPRVAKVVSAAVWAVSFIVVLPVVIFSDVQDMFNSCNMNWPEPKDVWSTAFIIYTATVGFFGPLLIICLCYLLIVIKVLCIKGMRCAANGVDDGDPSAPRTEKTTAQDCILLSPRNEVHHDAQSSQISPHPTDCFGPHAAVDLNRSTPKYQLSSKFAGKATATAGNSLITSEAPEPPTTTALTTASSSASVAPQEQ